MADVENVKINFDINYNALDRAVSSMNTADKKATELYAEMLKLGKINLSQIPARFRNIVSSVDSTTESLSEADKEAVKFYREMLRAGRINLSDVPEEFRNIVGSVRESRQEVESFSSRVQRSMAKVSETLNNAKQKMMSVGTNLTANITRPLVGLGVQSIQTTMNFEASMSKVQATAQASGSDMQRLGNLARDMGAKTKFSASESAEAMNYMAMAGWKTTDIMGGLEGVMNLAASSGEDLATVSDIVTDSMTALGLKTNQSADFADLLANTARNANTNVGMMGETFKYAAPVAGAMGYSMQDLALATGLMANAGIKASQSGTSLRAGLVRLAAPPKTAAEAMKKYGIAIKDEQNKMLSMRDILVQLRERFAGLSKDQQAAAADALFGKTAMSGWLAVINSSEKDFNKLTNATNNFKGSALEMAETMQNNLTGQMTILKSAIEGIQIEIGQMLLPVLKVAVSAFQTFANIFLSLPSSVKYATIAFLGVVAVIPPLIIGLVGVISIIEIVAAGISTVAGVIGSIGIPAFIALSAAILAIPVVLGTVVAPFIYYSYKFINSIIPIKDTIILLKNIISGDLRASINTLVSSFGMSRDSANKLMNKFLDVKDKAYQLYIVLKDNLGTIMSVIGESFSNAIGSINLFSDSTSEAKNNTTGMLNTIISTIKRFTDYLYNLMDSFGMIPVSVKYAKDGAVKEFIELNSKAKTNLNSLLNAFEGFNRDMPASNKKAFSKMYEDSKIALDNELKYMVEHLEKKKKKQLSGIKSIFDESDVLSKKEEAKRIQGLNKYYAKETETLKTNNNKIKEIMKKAVDSKRQLTTTEISTIEKLRKDSESRMVTQLSDSKEKQRVILEEAKVLSTRISREEALEVIVQANRKYDAVVEKAKNQKRDTIAQIMSMRDTSKIITKDEANKMIEQANRKYKSTVNSARRTKEETINLASQKAKGLIKEADREKREIDTKTRQIKKIMTVIWNDIKEKIPGIVAQLVGAIVRELGKKLLSGIAKAMAGAALALAGGLAGLASTVLRFKLPSINTSVRANVRVNPVISQVGGSLSGVASRVLRTARGYATGTRNAEGGLSLVGERGPELINIPKGSKVYNNQQTNSIMNSKSSKTNIINIYGSENKQSMINTLRLAGI